GRACFARGGFDFFRGSGMVQSFGQAAAIGFPLPARRCCWGVEEGVVKGLGAVWVRVRGGGLILSGKAGWGRVSVKRLP
ncbi:MAG: hypothetical protein LBP43_03270, partial [Treponema sp.]|nr:hypothetical protein [Treponema sp.]